MVKKERQSTLYNLMEGNDDGGRKEIGSGLIPNWNELPRGCLLEILIRLSMEQRWLGPMFVCKKWMYACQDLSLNSVFDLETWFLSTPESSSYWSQEFAEKVDSNLRSVFDWSKGGLTEIRVRHCTDRAISYASERCPTLEVLCVPSSPFVTDASMMKIASNCPKLRELDISYSYNISYKSLIIVGKNCPNMEILKRNLYVLRDHRNGNMEAEVIGRLMPKLKHLELQLSTLNGNGLASICEGCLNLEYLDLYGCPALRSCHISASTPSLKNLKEIKLHPGVIAQRSGRRMPVPNRNRVIDL